MEKMNEFILNNQPALLKFFDKICVRLCGFNEMFIAHSMNRFLWMVLWIVLNVGHLFHQAQSFAKNVDIRCSRIL